MLKEPPVSFTGKGEVGGFEFLQKAKSDYGFIYSVTAYGKTWYEVFKRKVNQQYNCVSMPSSKSFGIWAWTASDYEKAKEYLCSFDPAYILS